MFDVVLIYVACMIINAMICKFVIDNKDKRINFVMYGLFSCPFGILILLVKIFSRIIQHIEYSSKYKNAMFLIEQFNKLIG